MATFDIPLARGVPGMYWGSPPNWLGGTVPGPLWTGQPYSPGTPAIDPKTGPADPRWRGALSRGYGLGTTDEADFRVLHHTSSGQTSLYLSWRVRFDPSVNNNVDAVYVGFQQASGTAIGLRLTAYSSAAANKTPDPVASIDAYTVNADGTTAALEPEPAWVDNNTRIWLEASPLFWTIQMRVPFHATDINQGLNLGDPFRMWYSIYVMTPGGVLQHTWPIPGGEVTFGFGTTNFPAVNTWDQFNLSSDAGASGGVTLEVGDVGVFDSTLTATPSNPNRLGTEFSYGGTPPVTNLVRAYPRNYSSDAINPSDATQPRQITATFRIANWGSSISDPATWDVLGTATHTSSIPVLGVGAAPSIPLELTWIVPASGGPINVGDFTSGAKTPHQCMLVELSGPSIIFLRNSVYRNMNFVPASKFIREAEISIVGAAPIAGGGPQRNVYLAVETVNMPPILPLPEFRQPDLKRMAGTGGDRPPSQSAAAGAPRAQSDDDGNQPPPYVPPSVDEVAAQGMPTYRVHVYHEIGRTLTIDGVDYPILRAQTSFGYYLEHDGWLTGWKHKLTGANLVEIAPDFYRLTVPEGGAARVRTEIEAEEGRGCLAFILSFFSPAILRWILLFIIEMVRRIRGNNP